MTRPALIWSLHDVTPGSFQRCAHLVDLLVEHGVVEVAILVVPAGEWKESQIATLRRWQLDGHLIGLHGWSHRSGAPRGLYHRLHSALLSRDVAEHLGRQGSEVLTLIERGVRWFGEVGLAPPRLYVPPAWALGAVTIADLAAMKFRWVETLIGIHDVKVRRFHVLPLAGFEADTSFRAWSLRASNRTNHLAASVFRRPLRVALHPNDLALALATEARRLIESDRPAMRWEVL